MRPPRVPNKLPENVDTIYFLTLCVEGRKEMLATQRAWEALHSVIKKLHKWDFLGVVMMPDHLHMLVGPKIERDESLSHMIRWFKRWFNEAMVEPIQWQAGGFDRILRGDESAIQKWHYMRENPVRAGLVSDFRSWPYQLGLAD
jgi:REP element-mobilizing transposase RayT